jgi:hypothetical protein
MRIILTILAVLLTASCAAPPSTVEECRKANWSGRGEAAGFEGRQREAAWTANAAKCIDIGVPVDRNAFMAAWERGHERYCTPRNALVLGRQVREYTGVCTGPQVATWLKAYEHGRLISDVDRDIDRIENDLRKADTMAKDSKTAEADRRAAQQREASLQQLRQTALLRRDALESQAIAQGWGLGR